MHERRSAASLVYRFFARPAVYRWSLAAVSLAVSYSAAADQTWGAIFADDIAFLARVAVGVALFAATLGLLTRLVAGSAADDRIGRHDANEGAHHVALEPLVSQVIAMQREVAILSKAINDLTDRMDP